MHLGGSYVALLLIMAIVTFIGRCNAIREFDKRRDLQSIPPLPASGYTVPLQGGKTCETLENCTSSLPEPTTNQSLRYIALAHGVLNYTCTDANPEQLPAYVSQFTSLYDARPLIAAISTEMELHNIVPYFLDYDYATLKNSTLTCIGNIQTVQGITVVDLFDVEAFPVSILQIVRAPEDSLVNLSWALSQSNDKRWNIYRVMTAGGAPPRTCIGQKHELQINYAAEYWFYQY